MNEAHSSCERTRTRSRGADTKREGGDQLFFVQLFLFGSFSAPSSPLFPPPPSSHPPTCCLPLCLTTPRGPPARSPTTFAADTSSPARVIASLGSYCSPSSSHLVSASWEGGMRWKGRHLGRSHYSSGSGARQPLLIQWMFLCSAQLFFQSNRIGNAGVAELAKALAVSHTLISVGSTLHCVALTAEERCGYAGS